MVTPMTMQATAMCRTVWHSLCGLRCAHYGVFVIAAELIFGYAATPLALISDAVRQSPDVVALLLAWALRGWRETDRAPHLRYLWRPLILRGAVQCPDCCWLRSAVHRCRGGRDCLYAPAAVAGWSEGMSQRRASPLSEHGVAVHARPPRRFNARGAYLQYGGAYGRFALGRWSQPS
jgi:hypothetical protein